MENSYPRPRMTHRRNKMDDGIKDDGWLQSTTKEHEESLKKWKTPTRSYLRTRMACRMTKTDELTNDGMDGYDLPIRMRDESQKTRNTSWERNPCHASQNLYLQLGECNTKKTTESNLFK